MTAPALKAPSIDLVAPAWLRLVPGVPADRVATSLPSDLAKLQGDTGFITVERVGGGPARDVPMRGSALRVSAWAAPSAGSTQVPWGRASDLVEAVLTGTYSDALVGILIDLSARGYAAVRVLTVYALGEPARVTGDPSGFARFDIDLLMNWRTEA